MVQPYLSNWEFGPQLGSSWCNLCRCPEIINQVKSNNLSTKEITYTNFYWMNSVQSSLELNICRVLLINLYLSTDVDQNSQPQISRYCARIYKYYYDTVHEFSPGSYWSSSHWRSAYKFEIIGGHPPIYGDFVFFIVIFQHLSAPIIQSSVAQMQM